MEDTRRHFSTEGFSLIEILIALVIFATIILAIAMLVPEAQIETRKAEVTSKMNSMAQKKIEQLRAADYHDPQLDPGWHSEGGSKMTMSRQSGSNSEYTVRWKVLEDQPAANMKTIDVEVVYQTGHSTDNPNPAGRSSVLTFRTFIVDKGETTGGDGK